MAIGSFTIGACKTRTKSWVSRLVVIAVVSLSRLRRAAQNAPCSPTWCGPHDTTGKDTQLSQSIQRRWLAASVVLTLPAAFPSIAPAASQLQSSDSQGLSRVIALEPKLKRLVRSVHSTGEFLTATGLGTQGVGGSLIDGASTALLEKVEGARTDILLPLQAAMPAAATEIAAGLTGELQERAGNLPGLFRSQMEELGAAMAKRDFQEYKSSLNGKVYSGGQIERALEELEETVQELLQYKNQAKLSA